MDNDKNGTSTDTNSGKDTEKGITRRDFLKKSFWLGVGTITAGSILGTLTGCSNEEDEQPTGEHIREGINSITNLKKKPIALSYTRKLADKDVSLVNFPSNKWSYLARIGRCLRRKPVTDAVEDRYNIPSGLLMAMMAQEGLGDPTMPNLPVKGQKYGDGGLGLIHIQAANAQEFGLHTLPTFTKEMCDRKHGKLINETISRFGSDLAQLVRYDDRFHPVLAVDAAARFLVAHKRKAGNGRDSWMHALKRYSGRPFSQYGAEVIRYRVGINQVTGDTLQASLSKKTWAHWKAKKNNTISIKQKINELTFSIDGHVVDYDEYLAYFEESMVNFELDKYLALEDGAIPQTNPDEPDATHAEKEENRRRKRNKPNTIITKKFVDTHQHNSEGYALFRYKVQSGDSPASISQTFDSRDKENGNRFGNTGALNIVDFKGEVQKKIHIGEVVYVKCRKNKRNKP